jgi:hypothetical protein
LSLLAPGRIRQKLIPKLGMLHLLQTLRHRSEAFTPMDAVRYSPEASASMKVLRHSHEATITSDKLLSVSLACRYWLLLLSHLSLKLMPKTLQLLHLL